MRKVKLTFIAILIIAALGAGGALAYSTLRPAESDEGVKTGATVTASAAARINSFEECVAQGYPVMESYPARCVADSREFVQPVESDGTEAPPPPPPAGEYETLSSEVRLMAPQSNDVVTSPLIVEGEAAGWYFEGEFPVRLLDGNGSEISWGSARAQGNWMTAAHVPFQATLSFPAPATPTGTLVLEKSNPRGVGPAVTVQIPVRFTP